MIGNIPKDVIYLWSDKQKLESFWEDTDVDISESEKLEVTPAFCSDATNEKTIESGKRWAEGGIYLKQKRKVSQATFENKPVTKLRVTSLERRSEGGRAYKIIQELNGFLYFFDMREDVILDTMLQTGISPGGTLNGEFIWAKVGTQMKWIRVGSSLHKKMIEATNLGKLEKLKELEIGGVYISKIKEQIYWGRFDYITVTMTETGNFVKTHDFTCKVKKNVMLFENYPIGDRSYRHFEFKNTHTMIKKTNTQAIPVDLVKSFQNYACKRLQESLKWNTDNKYRHPKYSEHCQYGEMAFITKHGEPFKIPADFQQFVDYLKERKQWIERNLNMKELCTN